MFTPRQLAAISPNAEIPGVLGIDMDYPSPPAGLERLEARHLDMVLVSSEAWKKAVAPHCRCPVRVVRAPRALDAVDLPAQPTVMFANLDANAAGNRYDVYAMGIARFLIRNPEAPALFACKPGAVDAFDILKRELTRFGVKASSTRMHEALARIVIRDNAERTADVGVSVAQAHGPGDAILNFAATGRPVIAPATGCARDVEGLALLVPATAEFYEPDRGRAHVVGADDLCMAFESMMMRETRQRYGRGARSAAFRSESRARAELDALLGLAAAHRSLDGVE